MIWEDLPAALRTQVTLDKRLKVVNGRNRPKAASRKGQLIASADIRRVIIWSATSSMEFEQKMRAVAFNYRITSSGTDQRQEICRTED